NLDIYVSTTGSARNDGYSPEKPVATLNHAFSLIPEHVKHRVTIHIASGTYEWTTGLNGKFLNEHIVIVGDGAGQDGDDGFTELIAPTAAAASSSQTVVKSSGLVANAYRGKTIEILTGAAAGDRRTIHSNTATDIVPVRQFTAAVTAGDLYRVIEPAVH